MEPYAEGSTLKRVPTCGHLFHSHCTEKWFDSRNQENEQRCPMCNGKLDITELKQLAFDRRNNGQLI